MKVLLANLQVVGVQQEVPVVHASPLSAHSHTEEPVVNCHVSHHQECDILLPVFLNLIQLLMKKRRRSHLLNHISTGIALKQNNVTKVVSTGVEVHKNNRKILVPSSIRMQQTSADKGDSFCSPPWVVGRQARFRMDNI